MKNSNFIKKHKYFISLLLLLSIAAILMFLPSWIKGNYFVGGGDVKTQWYPFYTLNRRTTINALKDHTLPFYSFVLFLGNNIWASKSSYGLFDIYNIFTYIINNNYFFIYGLQCFVKILVSGLSCYLLIDNIYKNKKTSLLAGLCYGLSSFAIYFTSQPGFLSFYSLVPLYFLGIELYLRNNKKVLFIIIVFILLLTNYYLFVALSLFSPLYFLYRYYNINKSFKNVVVSTLKLIGYYFVGVLLSGVVIIPAFLYVVQNDRIGAYEISLSYDDLSVYFHLFISAFVPNHTYIYGNNIFDINDHTLKEITLYSGSLIGLLTPQFISDEDKIFKKSTILVYLVLLVITFTPFFLSIINGLSGPCFRWFLIFIIFNVIVSSKYISNTKLINFKVLKISLIVEITLIFLLYFAGLLYKGYSFGDYKVQFLIFLITIFFFVLNYIFIKKGNKQLVITCFIELALFSCFYGYKSLITSISKDDINNVTSVLADNDNYNNLRDYFIYLDKENEHDYFRIYVPYKDLYWSFSHDLSIIYNLNGLMSYDSTFAPSFTKMCLLNKEQIVDVIDWEFNIIDTNIMNFLSTKYSITLNEEDIPFDNYEIVDNSYRGLIVALNLDYRPIVSLYSKSITYNEFKNIYQNDTSLLNEYIVTNSTIGNINKSEGICNNIEYYDNYFGCDLTSSNDGFAVLGLPYDEGWKITINGEKASYIECNGGMIGFNVHEGNNEIRMYFMPKGFKLGLISTIIGVCVFVLLLVIDIIRKSKAI